MVLTKDPVFADGTFLRTKLVRFCLTSTTPVFGSGGHPIAVERIADEEDDSVSCTTVTTSRQKAEISTLGRFQATFTPQSPVGINFVIDLELKYPVDFKNTGKRLLHA
eukprot:scaffold11481_cov172-Cylindrotheca_fusiformis.AAC.4